MMNGNNSGNNTGGGNTGGGNTGGGNTGGGNTGGGNTGGGNTGGGNNGGGNTGGNGGMVRYPADNRIELELSIVRNERTHLAIPIHLDNEQLKNRDHF